MRISAETAMKAELVKVMHDEAMKKTNEQIRILEEKQENYLKIIQKKNYEATYPKPLVLKNHQTKNPKAFYIQILGCRGAGKSTFLNRLFQHTGLRKYFYDFNFIFCGKKSSYHKRSKLNYHAKIGAEETTKETEFFDVTSVINKMPKKYEKVILGNIL